MTTMTDESRKRARPMVATDRKQRASFVPWEHGDSASATLWLRPEKQGNWPSASIQCAYDGSITISTKREIWEEIYETLGKALGKVD